MNRSPQLSFLDSPLPLPNRKFLNGFLILEMKEIGSKIISKRVNTDLIETLEDEIAADAEALLQTLEEGCLHPPTEADPIPVDGIATK